ncbi:hypothetical protein HQ533_02165 [Candidatus Woesearchaeota archaeon]|nr:hypothetical protein [Candidatus Woesearchaeota archaeon]
MTLKLTKLVVFLLVGLFLVSFVSASFGVYSEKNLLKLCRCSELEDTIKIKNTGSENTIYTLSSNLDFVEITPFEFELAPREVQDVTLLVKAPCESLRKDLKIKVRSDKGDNERIVKQIAAGQCANIGTKLYAEEAEIDPCKTANYRVLIKNLGPFTEKYLLSSNFNDYINYSSSEVELAPEEIARINATLELSCNFYGETPVEFFVNAEKNQLQSKLTHNLMINQYYAYTLDIEDKYNVCEEGAEPIKLWIENSVNTPNTYYFELVGAPFFVSLSNQSISLEGKMEGTFDLELNIREGRNLGFFEFTLLTWTAYGDIMQEKNISLNITDCYDISINIMGYEEEFCTEKKSVTVNVKNNGAFRELVELEATPDVAYFKHGSTTLNPGDDTNITLVISPEDKDETYDIVTRAVLSNNVSAEDHARIKVLSQGTCHYVDVGKNKYSMRRDTENSFQVKLINKGKTDEEYELSLESEFWITLENTTLELAAGETKTINLLSEHTQETEFNDYPVNLTIKLNYLEYTHDLVVSLKDKPLYVKAHNYFSKRPSQAATTLLVVVIVVLLFLVIFLNRLAGKLMLGSFSTALIIMIALLVIFAGLLYFYKGLPVLYEPLDYSEASETHFIWPHNTNYKMGVAEFVADPDVEDELELYLSEEIEEVNFSVVNRKMVFTPKKDWYGTATVSIVAKDSKGAFAMSPEITLEVIQREEYTAFQAYTKLAWYVNWALLVIAFILLSVIGFKKLRRKPLLLKNKKQKPKKKKRR